MTGLATAGAGGFVRRRPCLGDRVTAGAGSGRGADAGRCRSGSRRTLTDWRPFTTPVGVDAGWHSKDDQ